MHQFGQLVVVQEGKQGRGDKLGIFGNQTHEGRHCRVVRIVSIAQQVSLVHCSPKLLCQPSVLVEQQNRTTKKKGETKKWGRGTKTPLFDLSLFLSSIPNLFEVFHSVDRVTHIKKLCGVFVSSSVPLCCVAFLSCLLLFGVGCGGLLLCFGCWFGCWCVGF